MNRNNENKLMYFNYLNRTVPAHDTSLPAGLSTEEEELADDSVSFAPNEGPTVPPVSSLENIGEH